MPSLFKSVPVKLKLFPEIITCLVAEAFNASALIFAVPLVIAFSVTLISPFASVLFDSEVTVPKSVENTTSVLAIAWLAESCSFKMYSTGLLIVILEEPSILSLVPTTLINISTGSNPPATALTLSTLLAFDAPGVRIAVLTIPLLISSSTLIVPELSTLKITFSFEIILLYLSLIIADNVTGSFPLDISWRELAVKSREVT